MRHDISVAIIGTLILVAGLLFILYRSTSKNIIYVNCDSFKVQQEAQEYFINNNATQLDGDKDGVACEDLFGKSTPTPLPAKIQSIKPMQTPVKTMQPNQTPTLTPSPVVIKVEGKATVEVKGDITPTPNQTPTPSPIPSTPSPTPTPTPTLICVLGLCL